jgi:hypothetical protein
VKTCKIFTKENLQLYFHINKIKKADRKLPQKTTNEYDKSDSALFLTYKFSGVSKASLHGSAARCSLCVKFLISLVSNNAGMDQSV